MAEVEEVKTYKLKGVEVFSTGTWNDTPHDLNSLNAMVDAFNQTKGGWRPFLKLGHDPKQKIAGKVLDSGAPAIGWVDRLYVVGTKLLADFDYVNEKVYKMIKARAYRKVSCEIYYGLEFGGTKYSHLLSAVSLLGAEQPGVMNLDEILGSYQFPDHPQTELFAIMKKQDTFKEYSTTFELETQGDSPMADDKSVELAAQIETQKQEFAAKQAEVEAKDAEIVELKKFKEEAEAAKLKAELEAQDAKRAAFVTSLESKKLLTPATKLLVEQLVSDKKEFSMGDKPASREEVLESLLKLSLEAGKVNLVEGSQAEYAKKDQKSKDEDDDAAIKDFMKKEGCSYAQAYKAVMKKNKAKPFEDAE